MIEADALRQSILTAAGAWRSKNLSVHWPSTFRQKTRGIVPRSAMNVHHCGSTLSKWTRQNVTEIS